MTGESVEDRMKEVLAKAGYPVDGIEKEALFMVRESERGPLAEATAWQELGTSNPKTTARIRGILKYLRENPGVWHRIPGFFTGEGGALHLPGDLGLARVVSEGDPMPVEEISQNDLQHLVAFTERIRVEQSQGLDTSPPVHMGSETWRLPVYRGKDRVGSASHQAGIMFDMSGGTRMFAMFDRQATVAQMKNNPQKTRKGLDRVIHQLFFIQTYDLRFDQWDETLDFRWVITVPVIFVTAIIATYIIWVAFP